MLQHYKWTGQKQFYFWNLIELIFGYFVLFIKNLYYDNYSPQAQCPVITVNIHR
jgi:hypothetical protein